MNISQRNGGIYIQRSLTFLIVLNLYPKKPLILKLENQERFGSLIFAERNFCIGQIFFVGEVH